MADLPIRTTLFKSGIWALSGKVASVACTLLLNLALARSLPPSELGVYFIALNSIIIFASVGTFGMDQVATRFVALELTENQLVAAKYIIWHGLSIVLIGACAVGSVLLFSADWLFGDLMHAPSLLPHKWILVGWLIAATLQRQAAETFRGMSDIRLATLFGGLRNNGIMIGVATLATITWLALIGALNLGSVLKATAVLSALVTVMAVLTLKHKCIKFHEESENSSRSLGGRKVISEAWPLWLSLIIVVMNNQGTAWLAAMFDSAQNVALFAVAQRFVIILVTPTVVVNAVLPPLIARLYHEGELNQLEKYTRATAGLASLPCIIVLLGLVFVGKQVLGMLFGEFYMGAYAIMILLGCGQMMNVATGSWQIVLPMTGHKMQMLMVSLISALMLTVGGVYFGAKYGVMGVAAAFTLSVVSTNLLGLWLVRKYVGIWTHVLISKRLFSELFVHALDRARPKPDLSRVSGSVLRTDNDSVGLP